MCNDDTFKSIQSFIPTILTTNTGKKRSHIEPLHQFFCQEHILGPKNSQCLFLQQQQQRLLLILPTEFNFKLFAITTRKNELANESDGLSYYIAI